MDCGAFTNDTSALACALRDEINLLDDNGARVSAVGWGESAIGTSIRRLQDGSYVTLAEDVNIIEVLRSMGEFEILIEALEVSGSATGTS